MTDDVRLAAYLSGDLAPDDHAEMARRLAADPALRARADRIAATDELLASLPDIELPEDFTARLDDRLAPVLGEILDDELAAARARRQSRLTRWNVAAAAAAVAAVVGIGTVTSGMFAGSGDEATTMEAAPGDQERAQLAEQADATGMPAPQVVALDRVLDEQDLQALARDERWDALASPDLDLDSAQETATLYAEALSMSTSQMRADDSAAGTAEGGQEEPAAEQDAAPADGTDALQAVAACLPTVLDSDDAPVIPLYAELATYDGEEVVVYTAATTGADDRTYDRIEVWVVTTDGCQTRYFTQYDR